MRISLLFTAWLYALMTYSTISFADSMPQVPEDYPSHKALGECYTLQQIEQIQQQLSEYNITRVGIYNVLYKMAARYNLSDATRHRLIGFAENFEEMGKDMPGPDPDSDDFRNFDFRLGLAFTALSIFLNTNEEISAQFYDDRDNSKSELSLYLVELDQIRELYMSSLKQVDNKAGNNANDCIN